MFGDIMEDYKAHVEKVVSTKMEELNERISGLLSACSKETSIKAESDAVKAQLAGIEMRFRQEHIALVEAINAHTASTDSQTRLLEELCNEVKLMNEKVDRLCSHAVRLENIEGDVSNISNGVKGVAEKTEVVSSSVPSPNECVDDIRLVFDEKVKALRRVERLFRGRNLKSFNGGLCQCPQAVDAEVKCNDHLR